MKKRIASLLLCVVMAVSLVVVPAQAAYEPQYTAEAETLYDLGLFKGTGTNPDGTPIFSLQNKATRLQALIILIRLLGLEDEALATTAANPFSDVPNTGTGPKYAAYAYETGLTNGIGGGKFGNTNVTPAQFVTFVLRALGYDDKAGDFKVATAIAKGREIGLIESDMLTSNSTTLLRDECVKINYNALKTNMKGTTKTLSTKLIEDGVLTKEAVQNAGLYSKTVYIPCDPVTHTFEMSDVRAVIPTAVNAGASGYSTNDAAKKLAEMKITPRNIIVDDGRIGLYLAGITNKITARSYDGTLTFYPGAESYGIFTAIDKDYHLVGYGVIPPSATVPDKIAVTVLDYDGTEAIEETKKAIDDIYKSAKQFDKAALSREDITVIGETKKTTSKYLRVDTAKLPDAVQNAKYYYTYRYGDGIHYDNSVANGKVEMVKIAIKEALYSLESTAPSHQVLTEIGQRHVGGLLNEDAVVLLLDANKQVLGYTLTKPKDISVTETMMDETGNVLTSNDTRDYFAIQKEALKKNGTAALADAACFGLGDDFGWIDNPQSEADYINNVLYSFLVGNYSLSFAFPSVKEFTVFESAVLTRWKELCSSHTELMGVYSNVRPMWRTSVNQKGNYLCEMVVEKPGLTEDQVYAQQLEAVKAVKELYNKMHTSGKITDTMTEKQIAQVYYDYFKSQNIKDSGLAWDTQDRGEVMKYDSLYACMVAKKADCLGRTAAFNMMMHMEGIYAKGLYCHPIGEPEGANHTLSYVMLDGAEYASDWGNNMSTRTLEEARAKYEFFDDPLQYARNNR